MSIHKGFRSKHPKLKIIIAGDSLYSNQPFIEQLRENKMSFILVAKPGDHVALMEWVKEIRVMDEMNRHEMKDLNRRELIYELECFTEFYSIFNFSKLLGTFLIHSFTTRAIKWIKRKNQQFSVKKIMYITHFVI